MHAHPDPATGVGTRTDLPERAVRFWQVGSAIFWTPLVVLPLVAGLAIPGLPTIARIALAVVPLVLALIDVLAIQPARRKVWWYAIGDEQIDLVHGWLVITHTVIPMTRVQHVALQQGPLARRFSLAQLDIHTAAGSVTIPALDRSEGERIRQHIAELARIADDL